MRFDEPAETALGAVTTTDDLRELHFECAQSVEKFGRVFMPGRFSKPFSGLHKQIAELLDSRERKVVIAAPRGIGKTSLCLAKAGQQILYRGSHFIPFVGQSEKLAMMQTENLKRELLIDPFVLKLFGNIKTGGKESGMDESFSKIAWVAKLTANESGTFVLPRGAGQAIRGVSFLYHRPDFFIVDDFEDSREIANDEIRKGWRTWFYADLEKSVSRADKNWRIVYIDTVKHEDALIQRLLDSPDYTGVRLEICDDELRSNAPDFMTDDELRLEYKKHELAGELDVFAREYRNLAIDPETAAFKNEFFQHYSESELTQEQRSRFRTVVLVDPAKTATMHSADSAVVGVSIDTQTRAIYVRDVVSGKFYPNELYKAMFDMVVRLGAFKLAVEVTGLDEFIKQPIKNFARVAGIFPSFVWLKARKSKEERIAALVPYYRSGHVWHNVTNCTKLEQQLLGFPRSKLWDVMDCFAYVVEFMELDGRYFDPGDGLPEEDDESIYDELENDSPLSGWRF